MLSQHLHDDARIACPEKTQGSHHWLSAFQHITLTFKLHEGGEPVHCRCYRQGIHSAAQNASFSSGDHDVQKGSVMTDLTRVQAGSRVACSFWCNALVRVIAPIRAGCAPSCSLLWIRFRLPLRLLRASLLAPRSATPAGSTMSGCSGRILSRPSRSLSALRLSGEPGPDGPESPVWAQRATQRGGRRQGPAPAFASRGGPERRAPSAEQVPAPRTSAIPCWRPSSSRRSRSCSVWSTCRTMALRLRTRRLDRL